MTELLGARVVVTRDGRITYSRFCCVNDSYFATINGRTVPVRYDLDWWADFLEQHPAMTVAETTMTIKGEKAHLRLVCDDDNAYYLETHRGSLHSIIKLDTDDKLERALAKFPESTR